MIDLHPTADNLGSLISSVSDGDLGLPTPCSEYTVGDLLDHIAGATIAFGGAAAKAGGASADMGPQGDAGNLEPDRRATLPLRVKTVAEAWRDPGAWEGTTRVGGQDLPGAVAGIITFGELTVHGWDLAKATGLRFEPDPAGLNALFELASQSRGPGDDGPRGTAFGPVVAVPEDAPVLDPRTARPGPGLVASRKLSGEGGQVGGVVVAVEHPVARSGRLTPLRK